MSHCVRIRHPGYTGANTLFTLPASGGLQRDRAHYATVRAAGSIITNNSKDVWLSKTSEGTELVAPDSDGLIPAGEYFLQVAQQDSLDNEPFPIVPNFRAWPFPHGSLPPLWEQASPRNIDASQTSGDPSGLVALETCRITQKTLACDGAHIIPASEKEWFTSNEMDRYGQPSVRSGATVAETSSNLMRLRMDAHRLWDSCLFSIIAKEDNSEAGSAAWFTQVMIEGEELYEDWHGRRLQSLASRPPEYLYARFAWNLFPRLHGFLQGGQQRRLTVRASDGTMTTRAYDRTECWAFTVAQGQGRSASSTKRARSAAAGVDEAGADDCFDLPERPHSLNEDDAALKTPGFDSVIGDMDSELQHNHESAYAHKDASSRSSPEHEWLRYLQGGSFDPEQPRGRKRHRS